MTRSSSAPRFDDHCGRPLTPPYPFDLRIEVLRILRNASVYDPLNQSRTLGAHVLQISKILGWETCLLRGVIMPGDKYKATVRKELDRLVAEGLAGKPSPKYPELPDRLAICGERYVAIGDFKYEPAPFRVANLAWCFSCDANGEEAGGPRIPVNSNGECEACSQREGDPDEPG